MSRKKTLFYTVHFLTFMFIFIEQRDWNKSVIHLWLRTHEMMQQKSMIIFPNRASVPGILNQGQT